ncbi:hypothetical protein KJ365_00230 [Glaciecola sp. XM2]|jgi:hypothetical protein|uniref:hypothetical protein n=1 Tax=Glaciecola sp. XM2 TaxID=1914931 RepID=UPI001BDE65B6|nr:hypothetical protein [Glaciecola sp. XM2]MBT1449291.1 hypothetical protein [Glaciecola sp. XM2]
MLNTTKSVAANNADHSTNIHLQDKPDMSQVSMLKGYWFYFKHNNNDISVHGSSWSGKEVVYFNNHPVSMKRNVTSFKTTHEFEAEGVNYTVNIHLVSVLKGAVETEVFANGESIGKETLAITKKGAKKEPWYKVLAFIAAFFVAGAAFGYFVVSFIVSLLGS